MTALAAIRPDEWNFPLLLHVLGAALLVGALVTAGAAQVAGWRWTGPAAALAWARMTFFSLVAIAVPAWVLMRFAGQWIASKENFDGDDDPTWIDIGYITAEPGGVLILVAAILAGLGTRRLRTRGGDASALSRVAGVIALALLAAYLVAVWAMTTKPA